MPSCALLAFLLVQKVGGPMDGFMVQSVNYIVKGMKQNSIRRIVLQNGGFTVLPGEAAPGCYVMLHSRLHCRQMHGMGADDFRKPKDCRFARGRE